MRSALFSIFLLAAGTAATAATIEVAPQTVTEWKSVYGQVETRDLIPARARIAGTVIALDVTEGDQVMAGQRIAVIEDDKLNFQIDALDAQLEALQAQLNTARSDLARGEVLIERGVITNQRLEQLQTAVNVLDGQISSLQAEKLVAEQRITEGEVLAPDDGIVLSVPVSRGSVLNPGEALAQIGGGGAYLRLAVPERHARDLSEGDTIEIDTGTGVLEGTLVKIYPQIEGGRVQADVEVDGLDARFVGLRMPVRLPVGERQAILVPQAVLSHIGGLDFITVEATGGPIERVVVPGGVVRVNGETYREILSGLAAGDVVVTDHE
ncbi:efflux RND transporter periplasmic adaptor subunit [Mesobacterium sp. TK19101]|uniref:Efflux RND transporter periplasmic adaptor subunit n=1 Tax=Mesobacterium hydrothermale TaxID=3111907 RepID=A0ABU6HFP8_9RHOB|nr:efflux RND transporter periplasmic adaptor subunit [Mesobacterium sp. TK19101]MEC3860952.1 efflux RND transporter periplasmic adaptor subunit [Mesobacterium sp. TK19101]